MHDLEAQRSAAHFAETANARAARQVGLLRAREIEEAQRQRAGAVGDAAQELAAAAIRHLGELDFAFDHGATAGPHAADLGNLRAVLVARRQHEQQVLHLRDAELRELLGERRAYAAQARDRTLFEGDLWRGRCHVTSRLQPRCRVHSISTRALRGSAATATVERAGYGSVKYFAMSSLTLAKFAKSVRKMVTFTTCAERATRGGDHGLDVLEHARGFLLEVALDHLHGDGIERDLARHVHRVADAHGL